AAGVQLRHDHFGRRYAFALVNVGRNAAAVVAYGARTVGVQRHIDAIAITGERLVDRIVDDLVDHMVQARAVVGIADIHAGPLAPGIEALQDLDGFGVVGDGLLLCCFSHGSFHVTATVTPAPMTAVPATWLTRRLAREVTMNFRTRSAAAT